MQAAREFHAAVFQPHGAGLVVFFCAPTYDLDILAGEMARLFAGTPIIGCTTAGEIGPDGYVEGSVTGFSLPADECTAASVLIPGLSDFNMTRGHDAAEAAIAALAGRSGLPVDPATTFAMLLSDGISTNQEALIASLQGRMANLQMLGGAAGNDMHYERTCIYHDGAFHPDAALLTLVKTSRPSASTAASTSSGPDQDGGDRGGPGRPRRQRDQRRAGGRGIRPDHRPAARSAHPRAVRGIPGDGACRRRVSRAIDPAHERRRQPDLLLRHR